MLLPADVCLPALAGPAAGLGVAARPGASAPPAAPPSNDLRMAVGAGYPAAGDGFLPAALPPQRPRPPGPAPLPARRAPAAPARGGRVVWLVRPAGAAGLGRRGPAVSDVAGPPPGRPPAGCPAGHGRLLCHLDPRGPADGTRRAHRRVRGLGRAMMTPPRRQQDRSAATRKALLAAARQLFTERGYAAVPAEDIVAAAGDSWTAATRGLSAFLDACQDPAVIQIALTDAPAVLGWAEWRAVEADHGLGLITAGLDLAMAEGVIIVQPVTVLAHLILSAIIEAALL